LKSIRVISAESLAMAVLEYDHDGAAIIDWSRHRVGDGE